MNGLDEKARKIFHNTLKSITDSETIEQANSTAQLTRGFLVGIRLLGIINNSQYCAMYELLEMSVETAYKHIEKTASGVTSTESGSKKGSPKEDKSLTHTNSITFSHVTVKGLDVKQVINKLQRIPKELVTVTTEKQAPLEAELNKKSADIENSVPAAEASTKSDSVPDMAPVKPNNNSIVSQEGVLNRTKRLDMPVALLRLMKLIHDYYGDDIIQVMANSKDGNACCWFYPNGSISMYRLVLEVVK